jgi:hypothetical protein
MKTPNPRCFGVWGGIGRKAEVQNPNGVSAKCAISPIIAAAARKPRIRIGTISRKTSDSTDKFNGQNPLDIAVANALELLRGQNFENGPRGDPRATRHASKYEKNMAKMST